jgi:Transmembrane domain of unknown function (DUF3566)
VTATSTSRGKDRTVSPGSEPDVTPDAAEPEGAADAKASAKAGGGSAKKRTSAAGQQRDEVVVHVPSPTDATENESDVRVAGTSSTPSSTNETVTDLSVVDTPESSSSSGSSESARLAADPAWTAATEPPGSVFAGRTDTPPPPPPPVAPAYAPPHTPGSAPSVTRAAARPADGKSPRKAHLQVSRFEPLSVMKFSFVMSLVCFVVLLVAVTVLYVILSGLGVFDSISSTINELTQEQGSKTSNFDASSWFSFTKIFGYTALIGGLNVLIITALATVWSVIYNIAADFVGGVEVTLKEAE